jgi:hypothetical protein
MATFDVDDALGSGVDASSPAVTRKTGALVTDLTDVAAAFSVPVAAESPTMRIELPPVARLTAIAAARSGGSPRLASAFFRARNASVAPGAEVDAAVAGSTRLACLTAAGSLLGTVVELARGRSLEL